MAHFCILQFEVYEAGFDNMYNGAILAKSKSKIVVLHDDPRVSIVMFEVAAWSWPVFLSTFVDESSGSSHLVFVIVLSKCFRLSALVSRQ